MNVSFTAKMEDSLDDLSENGKDWRKLISKFYGPFEEQLKNSKVTDVICEKCGSPMIINSGKYGSYYACSNYPTCKNTKTLTEDGKKPVLKQDEAVDFKCELCGADMVVRQGKFGDFYESYTWNERWSRFFCSSYIT